jgi:hypothetical protein
MASSPDGGRRICCFWRFVLDFIGRVGYLPRSHPIRIQLSRLWPWRVVADFRCLGACLWAAGPSERGRLTGGGGVFKPPLSPSRALSDGMVSPVEIV